MNNAKMVFEIEGIRYEKYPNGNTVNIYEGEHEFDVFTQYDIGTDFEKFEKSCREHFAVNTLTKWINYTLLPYPIQCKLRVRNGKYNIWHMPEWRMFIMKKQIENYLIENVDVLEEVVRELNGWNGCLDHLEVYSNDEDFFDMMYEGKPMDAVRASYYGDYNYMDDYVKINGYGNLESLSEYSYKEELKESVGEVVNEIIQNRSNISIDDEELESMLEELENQD